MNDENAHKAAKYYFKWQEIGDVLTKTMQKKAMGVGGGVT